MANHTLQDQVALVSGAGSESGIGLAITRRLAHEGIRVLLTVSSARIPQRAAELRAEGIDARAMTADLDPATALVCLSKMKPKWRLMSGGLLADFCWL